MNARFYIFAAAMFIVITYLGYSLGANVLGGVIGAVIGAALVRWLVYPLFKKGSEENSS